MDEHCQHLVTAPDFTPPAILEGCEECTKAGGTWTDLWVCLTCGHIGCGEKTPTWHSYEHFLKTGHPVVAPYDPEGTWKWCFADCLMKE